MKKLAVYSICELFIIYSRALTSPLNANYKKITPTRPTQILFDACYLVNTVEPRLADDGHIHAALCVVGLTVWAFRVFTSRRTLAARPPAPPVYQFSSFSGRRAAGRRASGACSSPDTSTAQTAARRRRRTTGSRTAARQLPCPAPRARRSGGRLRGFQQTFSHVLGRLQHALS